MKIENTEIQQYVVRFTVTEGDHSYTDALYFTPQEWADATDESIEAEQQRRFQNWLAVINTPAQEPTEAERQQRLADLIAQQDTIAAQIAAMTPQE